MFESRHKIGGTKLQLLVIDYRFLNAWGSLYIFKLKKKKKWKDKLNLSDK